jgi:hypothetical protein
MKCECGGKIHIMIIKGHVSHGICEDCLKNMVLPSYKLFQWFDKYKNEYFCEV